GKLLDPEHAPTNVAERLGFKCKNCGAISEPEELICPDCQTSKVNMGPNSQFADLFGSLMESFGGQVSLAGRERVNTTRTLADGTEETVVFERAGDKIRMLDQKALENRRKIRSSKNKKVLVKLTRNPFVMATGSSEAELLGDVLHDPYGGHEKLGSPAYQRVVPGAVHEAHEGVLFIDEISHLGNLQRYILTAMQDKAFPITGHNPQSAGASVRVDAVPCDFILVAACNIQDIEKILSPLRSRIIGNGYEVLVDIAMPDTDENRAMYAQFVAQEVQKDGHIPHAEIPAVEELIKEGRRRAKLDGQVSSLTLRLREMGGLIRAAGDLAVMNGDDIITAQHVKDALKRAMPVEEQIKKRYGSYTKGLSQDVTSAQKETSQYYFQNEHIPDDSMFN
ncbi:MAG: sigma 54-interacting transcriptional regulator, partial [Bacilli bacterium]